jgi:hypothetical protein
MSTQPNITNEELVALIGRHCIHMDNGVRYEIRKVIPDREGIAVLSLLVPNSSETAVAPLDRVYLLDNNKEG